MNKQRDRGQAASSIDKKAQRRPGDASNNTDSGRPPRKKDAKPMPFVSIGITSGTIAGLLAQASKVNEANPVLFEVARRPESGSDVELMISEGPGAGLVVILHPAGTWDAHWEAQL